MYEGENTMLYGHFKDFYSETKQIIHNDVREWASYNALKNKILVPH